MIIAIKIIDHDLR